MPHIDNLETVANIKPYPTLDANGVPANLPSMSAIRAKRQAPRSLTSLSPYRSDADARRDYVSVSSWSVRLLLCTCIRKVF